MQGAPLHMLQKHAIAQAFPAMQVLEIISAHLGHGALLFSLHSCSQLQHLALYGCSVDVCTEQVAAAAIAQLPSLKSLDLSGETPLRLAGQISRLTSLKLHCGDDYHQLVAKAGQDPQLLCVDFAPQTDTKVPVPAAALHQLLTGCPGHRAARLSSN
jgi:hypothetical protein